MKVDVTVPELAESITEAVVGTWLKAQGDQVEEGEQLVDVETDKVILEITAPQSGQLESIKKQTSDEVQSNEVLAVIDTGKRGSKILHCISQTATSRNAIACQGRGSRHCQCRGCCCIRARGAPRARGSSSACTSSASKNKPGHQETCCGAGR